jgi:hypothetical protein
MPVQGLIGAGLLARCFQGNVIPHNIPDKLREPGKLSSPVARNRSWCRRRCKGRLEQLRASESCGHGNGHPKVAPAWRVAGIGRVIRGMAEFALALVWDFPLGFHPVGQMGQLRPSSVSERPTKRRLAAQLFVSRASKWWLPCDPPNPEGDILEAEDVA